VSSFEKSQILRFYKTEEPTENGQSRGRHKTLYEDRQKNYKAKNQQQKMNNTDPTKTY